MRRPGAIKTKLMPDGGITISISCLEPDAETIREAVEDVARIVQDDAYGLHDKIRDREDRDCRRLTESETIDLRLKVTKSTTRYT